MHQLYRLLILKLASEPIEELNLKALYGSFIYQQRTQSPEGELITIKRHSKEETGANYRKMAT
jgi:hypothetical protein